MRVEIEDAPGLTNSYVDAPLPAGNSPKTPLMIAGVLLVAVVAGLFLLSPDEDRAADGTERSAPTTEVPGEDNAVAESDEREETDDDVVEPEGIVLPVAQSNSAIPADTTESFTQIIETEDGYLGLVGFQGVFGGQVGEDEIVPPLIARSSDGLRWDTLETTVSSDSREVPTRLVWQAIWELDEGFAAVAFVSTEFLSSWIAVSPNAIEWTILDTGAAALAPESGELELPIGATDESIIAANLSEQPVAAILRITTELDLPDEAMCGVFRSAADFQRYELFSCYEGESYFVGPDDVGVEWSPALVMECVGDFADSPTGLAMEFVEVDRTTGSVATFGEESSSWSPLTLPIPLRLAGVAFIDGGVPATSSDCENLVEMPDQRDPSVVILESDTNREGVFSLPATSDDDPMAGAVFGAQMVGETREFADRAPHLLIEIGEQLWSLNTTWGEWTQLFDPDELASDSRAGSFTLSTDGDRVYQATSDGLRIFDLSENESGVLEASAQLAPVGPDEWFSSVRTGEASVLIGSSEQVLLTDDDGALWILNPPPHEGSAETPVAPGAIRPVPIDVADNGFLTDVVATDAGFVATGYVNNYLNPQILRSEDGASWSVVEGVGVGEESDPGFDSSALLANQYYSSLTRTDDGFSVNRNSFQVEVGRTMIERLNSVDGETWIRDDALGTVDLPASGNATATVDGGVLMTTGQRSYASIGQIVLEHTDIDLEGVELCDAFTPAADTIALVRCAENLDWVDVTVDSVTSNENPQRVLECLLAAVDRSASASDVYLVGSQSVDLEPLVTIDGIAQHLWLQTDIDGSIIFYSDGIEDFAEACAGIVELDRPTQPSFVFVDVESGEVEIVSGPDDRVQSVLGHVQVVGQRGFLLVGVETGVSALNLETGEWSVVFDGPPSFPSVALSTDGDRIYQLGADLLMWDLSIGADGSLQAVARSVPIAWPGGAASQGSAFILHADSTSVIASAGGVTSEEAFWLLQVPEPPTSDDG